MAGRWTCKGGLQQVGVHHSGRWALSRAPGAGQWALCGLTKVRGDRDQVGRAPVEMDCGNVPSPPIHALALVSWSCADQVQNKVQKYLDAATPGQPPPPMCCCCLPDPFRSRRGGGGCILENTHLGLQEENLLALSRRTHHHTTPHHTPTLSTV